MPSIKRSFLLIGLIVFYFLAWRPFRSLVIQHWIYPATYAIVNGQKGITIKKSNSVSFLVVQAKKTGHPQKRMYKMAFGGYMLLSIIFLAGLGLDARWVILLFFFQAVFFVLETGMLLGGLYGWRFLFWGMDLLNLYLLPAFSFGIVAIVWYSEKQNNDERGAD